MSMTIRHSLTYSVWASISSETCRWAQGMSMGSIWASTLSSIYLNKERRTWRLLGSRLKKGSKGIWSDFCRNPFQKSNWNSSSSRSLYWPNRIWQGSMHTTWYKKRSKSRINWSKLKWIRKMGYVRGTITATIIRMMANRMITHICWKKTVRGPRWRRR